MLGTSLRPNGRRAVVVGGGGSAARAAEALASSSFALWVVAATIGDEMRAVLARYGAAAVERPYRSGDLVDAAVAVAATDNDEVNAAVVADARRDGILACNAFAIGSIIGHEYEAAARTLARMRTYLDVVVPPAQRRAILEGLAALPVGGLASLDPSQAEHTVDAAIERSRRADCGAGDSIVTAVCASRASALALVQTRWVAARLAESGVATTVSTMRTAGDRDQSKAIEHLGSINVFVGELESALREHRADYAVHSCKDLPSELSADMRLAAISQRDDPRDAFCSERYADFHALPAGAVVGTSSPRRRLQLLQLRPDLRYEDIRGNVDTRLRKLLDGRYDAIVLAMAGLNRLRTRATHTVAFDPQTIVPAVGQGALAIETRNEDGPLSTMLRSSINDVSTERCVHCERAALRALHAGCSSPIGIYARESEGRLEAIGVRVLSDGTTLRAGIKRHAGTLEEASALGEDLALQLGAVKRPLVVLACTRQQPSETARALRSAGAEVVELRAGDAGPDPAERTPDMLVFPSSGSVAAVRPYLARLTAASLRPIVAAMGTQSAQAAAEAGFVPDAGCDEDSLDDFTDLIRQRLRL